METILKVELKSIGESLFTFLSYYRIGLPLSDEPNEMKFLNIERAFQ